jgi:hypothetical protein
VRQGADTGRILMPAILQKMPNLLFFVQFFRWMARMITGMSEFEPAYKILQ